MKINFKRMGRDLLVFIFGLGLDSMLVLLPYLGGLHYTKEMGKYKVGEVYTNFPKWCDAEALHNACNMCLGIFFVVLPVFWWNGACPFIITLLKQLYTYIKDEYSE